MKTVVIIGSGPAGLSCAETLRTLQFDGSIEILSNEHYTPYDRTWLSKAMLSDTQVTPLNTSDCAATIRCGVDVKTIDRSRRLIVEGDGRKTAYDALIVATGARARDLPSLRSSPRSLTIRTLADRHRLERMLEASNTVLVIGGGWLGLELAALVRSKGREVTIAEVDSRLCARGAPPELSAYLLDLHVDHSVDVRTSFDGTIADDGAKIVLTQHGRASSFDICIVAVGAAPRDELAAAAGLVTDHGIVTDIAGRTSDPAIFAIGDVSRIGCDRGDGTFSTGIESWRHAEIQGRLAANALLGRDDHYGEAAYFYSRQYGNLIQIAGMPSRADTLDETQAEGATRLWRYHRGGKIAVVAGVNRARDIRRAVLELPVFGASAMQVTA